MGVLSFYWEKLLQNKIRMEMGFFSTIFFVSFPKECHHKNGFFWDWKKKKKKETIVWLIGYGTQLGKFLCILSLKMTIPDTQLTKQNKTNSPTVFVKLLFWLFRWLHAPECILQAKTKNCGCDKRLSGIILYFFNGFVVCFNKKTTHFKWNNNFNIVFQIMMMFFLYQIILESLSFSNFFLSFYLNKMFQSIRTTQVGEISVERWGRYIPHTNYPSFTLFKKGYVLNKKSIITSTKGCVCVDSFGSFMGFVQTKHKNFKCWKVWRSSNISFLSNSLCCNQVDAQCSKLVFV